MDELMMDDPSGLAGLGILFGVVGIISLIVYLVYGFSLGKLFEKAGKPMWAGFIPVYNLIIVLELSGRPIWWVVIFLGGWVLSMIPIVGFIVAIGLAVIGVMVCIDFAKSFGKDTLWGVLIAFVGIIALPVMAFSDDVRYVGPAAGDSNSM